MTSDEPVKYWDKFNAVNLETIMNKINIKIQIPEKQSHRRHADDSKQVTIQENNLIRFCRQNIFQN